MDYKLGGSSLKHCGVVVIRNILRLICAEQTPKLLLSRALAFERKDEDIIEFQKTSIINKLFSFLLKKTFVCPNGHESSQLNISIGLLLKRIDDDETLNDLIKRFFAPKKSML